MKILNNANQLAGTVLAALACVAFAGCTDSTTRTVTDTTTTSSHTTLAAGDTNDVLDSNAEVPPAPSETSTGMTASGESATSATSTTTRTKTTKMKKHKAKKAHKKAHSAWVPPAPASDDALAAHSDDDVYVYDSDFAETEDVGPMDAIEPYQDPYRNDETISGVTRAPTFYREDGLSPFAQEPNSRMPKQIGSGQLTGEDKSTTVLEGPSLFQDPSALGRDLIH
jgi:hypothetical protein